MPALGDLIPLALAATKLTATRRAVLAAMPLAIAGSAAVPVELRLVDPTKPAWLRFGA